MCVVVDLSNLSIDFQQRSLKIFFEGHNFAFFLFITLFLSLSSLSLILFSRSLFYLRRHDERERGGGGGGGAHRSYYDHHCSVGYVIVVQKIIVVQSGRVIRELNHERQKGES